MKTLTIHLTDPLYAKLVSVAAKSSGQDKPSQLQIDNTFALLAHKALEHVFTLASKPEPVTKPLDVSSASSKAQTPDLTNTPKL